MWDERFSTDEYVYGKEANTFLVQTADQIPPGPVLSLADGEGRNGVYLATLGHEVTAVDGSTKGLAKARRLAAEQDVGLITLHEDLETYHIEPVAWSGIVSIFCHLPKPLRAKVHAQVVTGLRPGGIFILEAYSPRQLQYGTGGPRDIDLLMEIDDLKGELKELTFLRAEEVERDIYEGCLHDGPSSVTQIVARKE